MIDGAAELAARLGRARRPVVFTGAGVSTESGIPDFRSPGGVWARFERARLTRGNFASGEAGRRDYWEVGRAVYPLIRDARPNAAHLAVARLWRLGRLDCCITQNIDDLHRRAGLPAERIIELHGNAMRCRCLDCGLLLPRDVVHAWLERGVTVPRCPACEGVLKPTTVMFGEAMPRAATEEAERRACGADLFVVVGSSLVVYPAAYMPLHAKRAGAALVIVNLTPTPLDGQADLVIRGRAGEVMRAALASLGTAAA